MKPFIRLFLSLCFLLLSGYGFSSPRTGHCVHNIASIERSSTDTKAQAPLTIRKRYCILVDTTDTDDDDQETLKKYTASGTLFTSSFNANAPPYGNYISNSCFSFNKHQQALHFSTSRYILFRAIRI